MARCPAFLFSHSLHYLTFIFGSEDIQRLKKITSLTERMPYNGNALKTTLPTKELDELCTIVCNLNTGFLNTTLPSCHILVARLINDCWRRSFSAGNKNMFFIIAHQSFFGIKSYTIKNSSDRNNDKNNQNKQNTYFF